MKGIWLIESNIWNSKKFTTRSECGVAIIFRTKRKALAERDRLAKRYKAISYRVRKYIPEVTDNEK